MNRKDDEETMSGYYRVEKLIKKRTLKGQVSLIFISNMELLE